MAWELRFWSAQNIVIEGITFLNCGYDDVVLFIWDTHSITVRNLSFVNISGYGVRVYYSTTVTMSDVYFSGCAINRTCVGASFNCRGNAMLTIKRCSFVDLGDGDMDSYRDTITVMITPLVWSYWMTLRLTSGTAPLFETKGRGY